MPDDREQESAEDREQESAEDREQESTEDREQESTEDREQESTEDREQESTEDREQESTGDHDQDSSQNPDEQASEDVDNLEDDAEEDRDKDSSRDREQDSSGGGSKRRTAAWAIAAVRSQFSDLSGQSLEQITGVAKGEDSTWTVGVEVLEIRMVPDTADILAQYDVKVDQDGDIIEYRRVRRYLRGRADD